MPSCNAQDCKNSSKEGSYKIYSIPIKDKERCAIWIANTPKKIYKLDTCKYSVLCQVF